VGRADKAQTPRASWAYVDSASMRAWTTARASSGMGTGSPGAGREPRPTSTSAIWMAKKGLPAEVQATRCKRASHHDFRVGGGRARRRAFDHAWRQPPLNLRPGFHPFRYEVDEGRRFASRIAFEINEDVCSTFAHSVILCINS
jgi:hypothetical protein